MDTVTVIGIVMLGMVMIMLLFTHSLSLQRFSIMELLALLTVSVCVCLGYRDSEAVWTEQYFEIYSAQYSRLYSYMSELENASNTQEGALYLYSKLDKSIREAVTGIDGEQSDRAFRSAVLVQRDRDGGYAECYTISEEPYFWSECENVCFELIELAMQTRDIQQGRLQNGNAFFVITDKLTTEPEFAVIMEVSSQSLEDKLFDIWRRYQKCGWIILVIASILNAGIVFWQGRELKAMIRMMAHVSENKDDWKRLADEGKINKVRSNEMRALYKGLRQISTDIMRINYMKYKTLQIYYRFAPKDIDKIMGKASILDVSVNDKVTMEATLAYLSFDMNEQLEQHEQFDDINVYYTDMGISRKRHGGIIYNSSSDLSTIQIMFNKEVHEAVQFGIEMGTRTHLKDNTTFVLLHRTVFVYGISGDDEQNFTFVHSKEMKVLEKYIERLRQLGIRMAVTDYVYDTFSSRVKCRYVGYIEEGEYKFRLYEILDAYSAAERQRRIDTTEKFAEAMKLFYQSDFYFARTLFTEILKDCPDDDVAKHYIFKCESCLDEMNVGESKFSLF